MTFKQILLASALFAASTAAFAQSQCAADPQAKDAAACDLAGWMAAYGRMTGEIINVVERLRALASSNPQFNDAETRFTDAQQAWHVRVIADCDARTAAIARYVAELARVQAAPGTQPPVAPTYQCPYTEAELATVTPKDACMVRAAARRCDNPGDACIVRCLATGGAKFIGGGCYHVCARYGLRGETWQAPAEGAACASK